MKHKSYYLSPSHDLRVEDKDTDGVIIDKKLIKQIIMRTGSLDDIKANLGDVIDNAVSIDQLINAVDGEMYMIKFANHPNMRTVLGADQYTDADRNPIEV